MNIPISFLMLVLETWLENKLMVQKNILMVQGEHIDDAEKHIDGAGEHIVGAREHIDGANYYKCSIAYNFFSNFRVWTKKLRFKF